MAEIPLEMSVYDSDEQSAIIDPPKEFSCDGSELKIENVVSLRIKALKNQSALGDISNISDFDLWAAELPDVSGLTPPSVKRISPTDTITLDATRACGPVTSYPPPMVSMDDGADEDKSCYITTKIRTKNISTVVDYLTASGPVYVDCPGLDHYQKVTPYHVLGNDDWRLINSKIECVSKSYTSIPGYKRQSPWDSFSSGEKRLCLEMASKMRKESVKAAKKQVSSFNLEISRKLAADSLKKAMADPPKCQKSQEEKLVLGPVVAWQPPLQPGQQDMGDFKAIVKGFAGEPVSTRSTAPVVPEVLYMGSDSSIPADRPLIKLEPTTLAQARKDEEDAGYFIQALP